ncbi:hypothetical protein LSH36_434g02037 [Paralvinella palmiformis]|uniref:EF-hand domain-containing protein n=1 Tax=Paralvinella palmiformis TaxID=53620 RepID=A0AAD9JB79_9ANNE|nr:hypothetical protein LSH36_434g02037 [Paralvinella palmiformis]
MTKPTSILVQQVVFKHTWQDSEDKRTSTGCCGLTFIKRSHNRRSKRQKDSTQDNKDNKETKDIVDAELTKDPESSQINLGNPINLAGITLNLNVTPSTNMDKSHQEPDNRLEEFKQLFCGGNELHSVDFIRIWGFYDKVMSYHVNSYHVVSYHARSTMIKDRVPVFHGPHPDQDHSGYLETKELDKFIKDLILQKGQKPYPDMVKDVREAVLKSADINKDGKIELSEFARCLPVEKNFLLQFDNSRNVERISFSHTNKHFPCNDLVPRIPREDIILDILSSLYHHSIIAALSYHQSGVIVQKMTTAIHHIPPRRPDPTQLDITLYMLTRKEFNEIFKHYDPDGNGFIEGHEILALLRDILSKLGMNVGAQELIEYRDNVIKVYDKNADGKLSRDELGMLLSVDK